MLGHEINRSRGHAFRRHDEVALVFAIRVVHDNDHLPLAEIGHNGFNRVKLAFSWMKV